jgi:hypothetical protein
MLKGMQLAGFGSVEFDLTPPSITSGASTTVAENAVLSFNVTTDSLAKIVIGGDDAANFEMASPDAFSTSHTLRWASNGTKDFEAPDDLDIDNVYDITLTARDTSGNDSTPQNFAVTVTDDYDWTTSFTGTLVTNNALSACTVRVLLSAAMLTASGNAVRLLLQAAGTGNDDLHVGAMYIGEQAAAGDAYDMKASSPAPTQIFVGASGSFTVPAGSTQYTDPLAFVIDHTKSYIVSFHLSSVSGVKDGTLGGAANYTKNAVNEAATADVTGYTTNSNVQRVVKTVEVSP